MAVRQVTVAILLVMALSVINGEEEFADTIIISKDGINYFRVCEVNSMVEVAEICRTLDGDRDNVIVDPFFLHINCRSPRAAKANLTCPKANETWLIKPNCMKPNLPFDDILDCFEMNERPCESVFFFHCFGFANNIITQRPFFTVQQEGEGKRPSMSKMKQATKG